MARKHSPCYRRLVLGIVVCLAAQPLPNSLLSQQAPSPPPEQKPQAPPAPPPVQAIPLPQIADQAEELDRVLREMAKNLGPVPEQLVSGPEAKAQAAEIAHRAHEVDDLLAGIPNLMQLQGEDRYWRTLAQKYGSQRKLLTSQAASIEEKIRWLDGEEARWQATSDAVRGKPGLEVVAHRVQQEIDSIRKLRSEAREQLNVVLTLQNTISAQDGEIALVLRKLGEAQERLRGRLFERDSYPLWARRELRASDQPFTAMLRTSASRGFTGAWTFLRVSKTLLISMAAMYVFTLLIAFHFRKYAAAEDKTN